MHPDAANPLLPLVTLAAGVFLLIAPRIVSVAVAVYLIVAGLLGLNGDLPLLQIGPERGTEAPRRALSFFSLVGLAW